MGDGKSWTSRVCPRWLVDERSGELCRMYRHYKNGVLAFSGGLLEQPNVYVKAMAIIDERTSRIELEALRERAKHNANRL
jgi:hypothetical protein